MFYFRADGNTKIGAGHLMRCLTIAEQLARLLAAGRTDICFVCADGQSAELVRRHDFEALVLGTDYRDMESELPVWEQLLRGKAVRGILVDSYYVTDGYLKELGGYGAVILLEDSGKRAYPVHTLINYNAPADPEKYRELYDGTGTRLLIGSLYAPIREQFSGKSCGVSKEVREVLITTGGGDEDNIAGQILSTLYREELQFHLVVGQFNPFYEELQKRETACTNIRLHSGVTDMAGLMSRADIAITAGGSTIYELAALGIPFLCFSYAENQEALTEYIGRTGTAGFAGAYHRKPSETLEALGGLFESLVRDVTLRQTYHDRELMLVDGKGAGRLAKEIVSGNFAAE